MSQAASIAGEASERGRIASLVMYDPPGLRAANDELWRGIADRLRSSGMEAPRALTRDLDLNEVWRSPGLLLGQTCGYPLSTSLKDVVRVVATPRYLAPGCAGAFHRSAIVVDARNKARRLEALRGARCVINAWDSNTGMNLLRAKIAPLAQGGRFFSEVKVSGSHLGSMAMIASGDAEVAAIDTVTLALVNRHDPDLAASVRVISWTAICPALPIVTTAATSAAGVAVLRRTLNAVAVDPELAAARKALLLDGFTVLPAGRYDQIVWLERQAAEQGYPVLA